MIKRIINYIKDDEFKIIYFDNNVNVINDLWILTRPTWLLKKKIEYKDL